MSKISSRVYAIINPKAAYGMAKPMWQNIRPHIMNYFPDFVEYFTKNPLHACGIVQQVLECKPDLIISVGGDGTLNEIIHGMLSSGKKVFPPLALLPIGSGTDFARSLNLPRDLPGALEIIRNRKYQYVDVGKVIFKNSKHQWIRYFINVFDVGLGGLVVRIANRIPKNIGGFFAYLISSVTALISFQPIPMRIWADDMLVDRDTIMIVGVANGQYFGGGMFIAPMASIGDGYFEILYVKEKNLFKFTDKVLAQVYQGKHLEYEKVYHVQAKKVRIQCSRMCLMDIDGEEEKAYQATLTIVPRAIKIITP